MVGATNAQATTVQDQAKRVNMELECHFNWGQKAPLGVVNGQLQVHGHSRFGVVQLR